MSILKSTVIALVMYGLAACSSADSGSKVEQSSEAFGDGRPVMLASLLAESPLKTQLNDCDISALAPSVFSISHRGAPFAIAEHTREGYVAAAQQGAGAIECDVTFTKDRELVCRHSQCDLHSTTNILETELVSECQIPPDLSSDTPFANVQCCTSDISLAQFKTLKGKRDGGSANASSVEEYLAATPGWIPNADSNYGELLSHRDAIELFDSLGVSMVPELKVPQVPMPFQGDYMQVMYASQMLDDYVSAGVDPSRVFAQSFNLEDIRLWLQTAPEFGRQAVYLDGRYSDSTFDIHVASSWSPTMDELAADGVRYLASPLWMLLSLDSQQQIIASDYARAANAAGMNIIAWTIERSGPITSGDNWYYQSIQSAIDSEGDVFSVIDVLVKDVGVAGIFSDWPATTSFYEHCVNE